MPISQVDIDDCRSFYGMLTAVRLRLSANVALSGLQNLQGHTGADGDRILCSSQTNPAENGIYVMRAAAWERAVDCELGDSLGKNLVLVEDGEHKDEIWKCDNPVGSGVVGTDNLEFVPFLKGDTSGYFSDAIFVWNVNGSLSSGGRLDGIRGPGAGGRIIGITMAMGARGADGDTIVDIKKHTLATHPLPDGGTEFNTPGTTIYNLNPANRPTVAGSNGSKTDNAIHRAFLPDIDTFLQGDFFTIDLLQSTANSKDLTILVNVRYD